MFWLTVLSVVLGCWFYTLMILFVGEVYEMRFGKFRLETPVIAIFWPVALIAFPVVLLWGKLNLGELWKRSVANTARRLP